MSAAPTPPYLRHDSFGPVRQVQQVITTWSEPPNLSSSNREQYALPTPPTPLPFIDLRHYRQRHQQSNLHAVPRPIQFNLANVSRRRQVNTSPTQTRDHALQLPPSSPPITLTAAVPRRPYQKPAQPTYFLQGLDPLADRISTLTQGIAEYSETCVLCTLLSKEPLTAHNKMFRCSHSTMMANQSEYRQHFRNCITFSGVMACFRCGVPTQGQGHSNLVGNQCPHEDWQEWMKPPCYIIFRVSALKSVVFEALGIPLDTFPNLLAYAHWLGFDSNPTDLNSNLANLHEILITYWKLAKADQTPPGPHSFDVSATHNVVPSTDPSAD